MPRPSVGAVFLGVTAVAVGLALTACGGEGDGQTTQPPVELFAASSLTDVFSEMAELSVRSGGPAVRLTVAGSQILRLQIEQGAAADLFASANRAHAHALHAGGLAAAPDLFASTALAVVVAAKRSSAAAPFSELYTMSRLVIGTPHVPIGRYTDQLFANAAAEYGDGWLDAVVAAVVSREANVRLLRAKVELGEADAAIVYRADVVGRDALRLLAIPSALNVHAEYHIAVLVGSSRPEAARRFVSILGTPTGAAVLRRWGFNVVGTVGAVGAGDPAERAGSVAPRS